VSGADGHDAGGHGAGAHDRRDRFAASGPGRRLFIATPLSADAVAAVTDVVRTVRDLGLPAGARDVRWVRLDGLHLTQRFLGPTPDDRIEAAATAVRAAAIGVAPIAIQLGGAGRFPPRGRPRTLWIGLTLGVEELGALSRRVDDALAAAGWPRDDRSNHPHLTLARSDGVAAGSLVAERLATAMAGRLIDATLDRLVLFESVTGGGPARYVPVMEALLEAATSLAGRAVYHPDVP
jgi:2'-5' RNA ligase